MTKTTLSISELLQLQSTIRREVSETQRLVGQGAYKEVNGVHVTEEILNEELDARISTLDSLNDLAIDVADKLHEANRGTTFVHQTADGQEDITLNLASALDFVKQLRNKADLFTRLGNAKKKSVSNSYGSTESIITDVTHDIEGFAERAKLLHKEANRLSREIERQSVLATVEIEGVEAYL